MKDKEEIPIMPFKVMEHGLEWSPSGWVTYTIHWSDGSVTTEKRPCFPGPAELKLKTLPLSLSGFL